MARSIDLHTLSAPLPAPSTPNRHVLSRVVSTVALVVEALGEGLDASRRYEALRDRGVPHAVAIKTVLRS